VFLNCESGDPNQVVNCGGDIGEELGETSGVNGWSMMVSGLLFFGARGKQGWIELGCESLKC
jgi:hypothetical protein